MDSPSTEESDMEEVGDVDALMGSEAVLTQKVSHTSSIAHEIPDVPVDL
jgi:hypothetical protein